MSQKISRWCAALFGLALAVAATGARAQGCAANDTATSIRTPAGECFSFALAGADKPAGAPLVVFLHGDGGGSVGGGYWDRILQVVGDAAAAGPARIVALVRPGYRTPSGRSDGSAKSGDDDYTADNVRRMAEAIAALRQRFAASRVIAWGHSGGAATSALILDRHPGTLDAAVLAGCPCEIAPWRTWRQQSAGRTGVWSSLSPHDHVGNIPAGARIRVIAGDKDDNTLTKFSETYVAKGRARGLDIELVTAPGATHGNVWRAPEAMAALRALVR